MNPAVSPHKILGKRKWATGAEFEARSTAQGLRPSELELASEWYHSPVPSRSAEQILARGLDTTPGSGGAHRSLPLLG